MNHYISVASKERYLFDYVIKLCDDYRGKRLKNMKATSTNKKTLKTCTDVDLKPYQISKIMSTDLLRTEWEEHFEALFNSLITLEEFVEKCVELKILHLLQHKLVVLTGMGTYDDALNK